MPAIAGALAYGASPEQAISAVRRLATDVIEDRRMHREPVPYSESGAGALTMIVGGHAAAVVPGQIEGMLVGCVDALPGAHTQAGSLDELYLNLSEAITLVTGNHPAPGNLPEERLSAREN
ncbi:MAG TPA: hypothetical protein VGC13_08845 [Longimicrobium sp.]|jgi:predicted RNase H-like HicB family nuclease|uniref:type II toxin-antitoxin system HicB family antitoxin n=1 Tax=Longimicrobium sp. TaxID=2029185 RepID=UPI002EDB5BA8